MKEYINAAEGKNKMIKAVIFDMFETLVSLYTCESYKGSEIARDLGLEETKFRTIWNPSEDSRARGQQTVGEVIENIMRTHSVYDEKLLNEILRRRTAALVNTYKTYRPDIITMLDSLRSRGMQIGLITNCYFEERDIMKKSEIFEYFDVTCLSCELGITKPDQRIFDICLEKIGLAASECLYIGDGGSNELLAAKSCGMKACQATWYLKGANDRHLTGRLVEFPEASIPMDVLKYLD